MATEPATVGGSVSVAVSRGVRLLDTAYSDGCEAAVGRVLTRCFHQGYKREDFLVISKLPAIGNRSADVEKFLLKSLRNLGLESVDIYLIESPVGLVGKNDNDVDPRDMMGNSVMDLSTDLMDVWRGMEEQHRKGRARYIGVCNFNLQQIGKIINRCRVRPSFAVMDINAYNHREQERRWLADHFINPLAILPYGNPDIITRRGRPRLLQHPTVLAISQRSQVPPETVLIKYLVQRDVITLFQATSRKTLTTILESYCKLNLSKQELVDLSGLELSGSARLRDFIECQGCMLHPEFPFLYDVGVEGVMGGPWTVCRRVVESPPTTHHPLALAGPPTHHHPLVPAGPLTRHHPLAPAGPSTNYHPLAPAGPSTNHHPLAPAGPLTRHHPLAPAGPSTNYHPLAPAGPSTNYHPLAPTGPSTHHHPLAPADPSTNHHPLAPAGPFTHHHPLAPVGPPTHHHPLAPAGLLTRHHPLASTTGYPDDPRPSSDDSREGN